MREPRVARDFHRLNKLADYITRRWSVTTIYPTTTSRVWYAPGFDLYARVVDVIFTLR